MASHISRLPDEILAEYFRSSDDPIHLWTACRNVSHQFRDAVEYCFRTDVLPETEVEFDWAIWEYLNVDELTDKCFFNIRLKFVGFKYEQKEIALFKEIIPEESGPEDP